MMYRYLAVFLFCELIGTAIAAQQGDLSLSGRVTNEVSGAPIARAAVILNGENAAGLTRKQVFTDGSGGFRFDGLSKGHYSVSANKPQFQSRWQGANATNNSVELTASKEGVLIVLTPLSSIEGRVTDSAGRPLQGVQIKAFNRSVSNGRQRSTVIRTVSTDDRGVYRMWDFEPQKLHLKAVGRAGGTVLYMSEQAPSFVGHQSFEPIYHDGTDRLQTSTPVDLQAGQEAQVDFRLRLQPAYKIRGTVKNLQPYKTAKFELLYGNEDITANRASLNIFSGKFEVIDVVPGSYRLRVTQGEGVEKVVAEATVQVAGSNLDNVELFAFGGVELAIQIDVTGQSPLKVEKLQYPYVLPLPPGKYRSSQAICRVTLTSNADPYEMQVAEAKEEGGQLKVSAVLPGEYEVNVSCEGAYVLNMMLGNTDLSASRKLIVGGGMQPDTLNVRASRNGGSIEVALEGIPESGNPYLLVVPVFSSGEGPRLLPASWKKMPGVFAPGDYTVYLIKNYDFPYLDSQAIQGLRNGTSLRVNAGEVARVAMKEFAQ